MFKGCHPESLFFDATSIPETTPEVTLVGIQIASLLIFLERLYDRGRIKERVRLKALLIVLKDIMPSHTILGFSFLLQCGSFL